MTISESLAVDADGVSLHTELLLPPGKNRVPTLLIRTPYDLRSHAEEAQGWVDRGFGFAAQDVRGRHRSGGLWEPYCHEDSDGGATVDRLAGHPRVGPVVAYGGSYAAGTAWALSRHPAVAAVISAVPAMSLRQTILGSEGIAHLERHAWWWSAHGEGKTSRLHALRRTLQTSPDLFDQLPVTKIGVALGLGGFVDALQRAGEKPPEGEHDLTVPSLHLGGWWDPFVESTWAHSHLPLGRGTAVIGPWGHDLNSRQPPGILTADPRATLTLGRFQADWLRLALEGEKAGAGQIWVGGDRGWIDPGAPVSRQCWELDSQGRLVPDGDAGPETEIDFDHDPARPLPGVCWPIDISPDGKHPDCRRFRSARLHDHLTLCGIPEVAVVYSTAGRPGATTDIVARLSREMVDGSVIPLSYGIHEVATTTEPRRVTVPMRPVGVTVAAGERLVLDLSGSFFPRHARNPQRTGVDRIHATQLDALPRRLTVGAGATALHLPVVGE